MLQSAPALRSSCATSRPQVVAAAHPVSGGVSRAAAFAAARPAGQKLAVRCQAAAAEAAAEAPAAPKAAGPAPGKPTLLNQPPPPTYAIIEISGKQMFVEPGKWYVTNRLKGVEVGDSIRLGRVLALKSGGEFSVGKPYLEGVAVEATILEEFRGPKIIVYKMKPKKHYRRKNGHRQELTKFMVTKVEQQ